MSDVTMRNAYSLHRAGQLAEAAQLYGEVLRANPRHFDALRMRGAALSQLGRHEEALAAYDAALALDPGQRAVWNHRGNALLELGRPAEAVASYDRALALNPDYADAWRHRGLALSLAGQREQALASYGRALALKADYAEALEDRGNLLMGLRRHAEAEADYAGAIACGAGGAHLHCNRANALSILKRYEEAIDECGKALRIDPDYPYARGVLVHSKLQCCDWRGLDGEKAKIAAGLARGLRVVSPFNHKALSDSPEEQLRCAEVWAANELPAGMPPLAPRLPYRHRRIRLAYVSADFNASAVATLTAGVFEHHDRDRFETVAISFGTDARTPTRARLEAAFERFIDVRTKTDAEIAALMRELEVDIAVDLMGYTGECRSGILVRRPAPVQVNYLGFPGTMGAGHIDYIIADRTVLPEDAQAHYTEKPVYLPGCYLPNDSTRAVAGRAPSRAEAGLPEKGFVFASFNNAYKFAPAMFDVWMRLLRALPASVLWLPRSHPAALGNLRREAEARGVEAGRLVFAPPVPAAEDHLARLRLADLFLDTLPYNAHTTAMDALWAGLPLLTCLGGSFAGRVAASLLRARGLPELVAHSLPDYESLALGLARDPAALAGARAKLAANREASPLFDTARFARNLEAAFAEMQARHERGDAPASFAVEDPGPLA